MQIISLFLLNGHRYYIVTIGKWNFICTLHILCDFYHCWNLCMLLYWCLSIGIGFVWSWAHFNLYIILLHVIFEKNIAQRVELPQKTNHLIACKRILLRRFQHSHNTESIDIDVSAILSIFDAQFPMQNTLDILLLLGHLEELHLQRCLKHSFATCAPENQQLQVHMGKNVKHLINWLWYWNFDRYSCYLVLFTIQYHNKAIRNNRCVII